MSESTLWLAVFLLLALAGLAGMFLYGWKRRKEKMPKVAPLPDDDDDWK
jgi:LPXTG-motif cell wall-anchored protein